MVDSAREGFIDKEVQIIEELPQTFMSSSFSHRHVILTKQGQTASFQQEEEEEPYTQKSGLRAVRRTIEFSPQKPGKRESSGMLFSKPVLVDNKY